MDGLFQGFINDIKAGTAPVRKKIKLFTNPDNLKTKIIMPVIRFLRRAIDIRPKDESDYYSFFGWLVGKRLAFLLVIVIGLASAYYVLEIQPLSVFTSDESGIKTYTYDSIPLRFTEGKVRILGKSNYLAYEGEVKKGIVSGSGILYRKDGTKVYEGQFENSQFQGEGVSYYPTEQVQYIGGFRQNLYHGTGSLYRNNGSLEYTGSFLEGKKDGQGTLYDSGNNEVFVGNFSKNQLLYRDFIGKSTIEANQMYVGNKTIYMDDEYFVVDMPGIDAVYYGSQLEESLTDEIMVEGIYVLKNTFEYSGEELKSIFEVNQFLEEPAYEGNSYVIMPEAVAMYLMNRTGSGYEGNIIIDLEQYMTDAVLINEFDDDYGIYIYTYIQEDMRYTFFSEDRSGKFFMYLIEKEK